MYKYLLCWRYLRTRYIALASIVSVTLGVATMIVVNSVMAGFSEKMKDRLHGILADIVVESRDMDGFSNVQTVVRAINEAAGDDLVATAPTMETLGIIKIPLPNGKSLNRPVQIIGVEPGQRAACGDFAEHLYRSNNKPAKPSFDIPPDVQELLDKMAEMAEARKSRVPPGVEIPEIHDPDFPDEDEPEDVGAILGYALANIHLPGDSQGREGLDILIAPEGTKVILTYLQGGDRPEPGHERFTVVGYFKSEMSEYDSLHVYVPLKTLQKIRRLGDGQGRGKINQIQVKLREGANLETMAKRIGRRLHALDPTLFVVSTWEEKQGPLLAAVAMEQSILNILLFFIIAVAGFGILAIFSMIVVEKTRDIGILKALGASTSGVRGIFLGYGLSLGLVGSGVGMVLGLLFIAYINQIEGFLTIVTGRKVFSADIYYFDSIPTLVEPMTVVMIVLGALLIAVAASVWPAQRASRLHPVQALRFE